VKVFLKAWIGISSLFYDLINSNCKQNICLLLAQSLESWAMESFIWNVQCFLTCTSQGTWCWGSILVHQLNGSLHSSSTLFIKEIILSTTSSWWICNNKEGGSPTKIRLRPFNILPTYERSFFGCVLKG
jgi:hypothetical protein